MAIMGIGKRILFFGVVTVLMITVPKSFSQDRYHEVTFLYYTGSSLVSSKYESTLVVGDSVYMIPEACVPLRLHGDDGNQRKHGDDGLARKFGGDGNQRKHGDDGLARKFGDDGNHRKHGDDGKGIYCSLNLDGETLELRNTPKEEKLLYYKGRVSRSHGDKLVFPF